MKPGIGPLARFFTRKMYSFVDDCDSWDGTVSITVGVLKEVRLWQEKVSSLNGFLVKQTHAISKVVY